jgi:hypothetical protein
VSEPEFVAWLARSQRATVCAIAALNLLHLPSFMTPKLLSARSFPAFYDACSLLLQYLITSTVLYDSASGTQLPSLNAVPWDLAQAGARLSLAYYLCIRLPANALLLSAASLPSLQAFFARRFELLFSLAVLAEMTHAPLVETSVLFSPRLRARALQSEQWGQLSFAVDHSWVVGLCHLAVGGMLLAFSVRGVFGPCRPRVNAALVLSRALLYSGCLPWTGELRVHMFRSLHMGVQWVLIALAAAMLDGTGARLRAQSAAAAALAQMGQPEAGKKEACTD